MGLMSNFRNSSKCGIEYESQHVLVHALSQKSMVRGEACGIGAS